MTEFSIGDVEKLTVVKTHVLRYWEQTIPMLAPRKDNSGRRIYGQRDLDFIFRLQYLITERKFTVEGAGEQLLREIQNDDNSESSILISQMRNKLLECYNIVKNKTAMEDEDETDKTTNTETTDGSTPS